MKFDYYRKRRIIVPYSKLTKEIKRIAKQLDHDYKDKHPVIVGLMNSSFMFLAELMLNMKCDVEIEFVKVFTYSKLREEKIDAQRIQQAFDWERLKNRNVIIVDELIDTGDSFQFMVKELKRRSKPKSIATCAMIEKDWPRPYFKQKVDYVGVKVPNLWITGHGMAYKYKYRNLKDVVALSDAEKGFNKYEARNKKVHKKAN
ncbi:MAG: hypothetical protein KBS35_03145 [Mycoplasma sp.]|nr:hypothetical protein [Candidatus Hennigella equi]